MEMESQGNHLTYVHLEDGRFCVYVKFLYICEPTSSTE